MNINLNDFKLLPGDLLFQDSGSDMLSEAIKDVTTGFSGARFDHIGIIIEYSNSDYYIVEAIPDGVVKNNLIIFLSRNYDIEQKPKVIVGRLKKEYEKIIPSAIKYIKGAIGKPYNETFCLENDGYYCSELIYKAFKKANNEIPFFNLKPMTYISNLTGKIHSFWIEYFKKLHTDVPEGKPGINPGLISLSNKIDIVYQFSDIKLW